MKKKFLMMSALVLLLTACKGDKPAKEEEEVVYEDVTYACRAVDYYNYSEPVPYSDAIEDSYFDDVLFAGDSRMGAMYLWGTIPNAQVEYVTSLNLWLIDSMPLDNHSDGMTMYDALEQTEKNNIYLLFGINEIRSNEEADCYADEGMQCMILYCDLNDIGLYDYEIGGEVAGDYEFVVRRVPGGDWELCNWGYR